MDCGNEWKLTGESFGRRPWKILQKSQEGNLRWKYVIGRKRDDEKFMYFILRNIFERIWVLAGYHYPTFSLKPLILAEDVLLPLREDGSNTTDDTLCSDQLSRYRLHCDLTEIPYEHTTRMNAESSTLRHPCLLLERMISWDQEIQDPHTFV